MLKRSLLHLLLALGAGSTAAHAAVKAKPQKAAAKKPAKAAAPKAEKGARSEADAYLAANKLEGKTVEIKLPGLQVTRTFVPVLPETRADFFTRFGEKNGRAVLRWATDLEHPSVYLAPKKGLTYGAYWNVPEGGKGRFVNPDTDGNVQHYMTMADEGRYLSMNVGKDLLPGLQRWWEKSKQPDDAKGGCMWWLVHAEVKKGQSLSHFLGVKRSAAPSNLLKKLVHAGNERVDVIGVAVPTMAAFSKMTKQQLLGTPPGGGAIEAIKE